MSLNSSNSDGSMSSQSFVRASVADGFRSIVFDSTRVFPIFVTRSEKGVKVLLLCGIFLCFKRGWFSSANGSGRLGGWLCSIWEVFGANDSVEPVDLRSVCRFVTSMSLSLSSLPSLCAGLSGWCWMTGGHGSSRSIQLQSSVKSKIPLSAWLSVLSPGFMFSLLLESLTSPGPRADGEGRSSRLSLIYSLEGRTAKWSCSVFPITGGVEETSNTLWVLGSGDSTSVPGESRVRGRSNGFFVGFLGSLLLLSPLSFPSEIFALLLLPPVNAFLVILADIFNWFGSFFFRIAPADCFLLAFGGLSRPSRQQKCLHLGLFSPSPKYQQPTYIDLSLHLWLHAHLPFSSLTDSCSASEACSFAFCGFLGSFLFFTLGLILFELSITDQSMSSSAMTC